MTELFTQTESRAIDRELISKIARAISNFPNGVVERHPEVEHGIFTSTNLSFFVLDTNRGVVELGLMPRSHQDEKLNELVSQISSAWVAKIPNGDIRLGAKSPAWSPNPNESFLRVVQGAAKGIGLSTTVSRAAGGLEPTFLTLKNPGLSAVAIGPNVENLHSVFEKLDVRSLSQTIRFADAILQSSK